MGAGVASPWPQWGGWLPDSIKMIRTVGIVLTALMLHGLGATKASAQLREVGFLAVRNPSLILSARAAADITFAMV
jgi:hypothetical protein